MANLIETILASMPADATEVLANQLGESPGTVTKGLGGIIPTVLGAMVQQSEHGGLGTVTQLVKSVLSGGNPLDGMGNLFQDAAAAPDNRTAGGENFVSSLFGNQFGPIAAALSGLLGLKGTSVRSLLSLAGPLVAGGIGKFLGPDPSEDQIQNLLKSERGSIMAALPAGVSSLLAGIGAPTAYTHAPEIASTASSGLSRWLPWLLVAIAAIALIFGVRSCNRDAPQEVDTVTTTTTETVVTEPATPVVPEGAGVLSEDRAGTPAVIVFFDTGQADVSPDLANAAAPLKAHLDANADATLSVSGYNDPTGDAALNAELSKNRAENVKAALVAAGLPEDRINLDKPVETTATGDTYSESRRVEIVVKN